MDKVSDDLPTLIELMGWGGCTLTERNSEMMSELRYILCAMLDELKSLLL